MADILLQKPVSGQKVTLTPQAEDRLVFQFDSSAATLTRDGDMLVMSFEDGATISLANFYVAYTAENMPTFLIEGLEVDGQEFFASLSEELMPAAGAEGGTVQGGGSIVDTIGGTLLMGIDRLSGLDQSYDETVVLASVESVPVLEVNTPPRVLNVMAFGDSHAPVGVDAHIGVIESGVGRGTQPNDVYFGDLTAQGQIIASDADEDTLRFYLSNGSAGSVQGQYGTFTLNADGTFSYTLTGDTLDNTTQDNVDSLNHGQNVQESFVVYVDDGRGGVASVVVKVNVQGTNDKPEVSFTADNNDMTVAERDDIATNEDDFSATGTINVIDYDQDGDSYAKQSLSVELDGSTASSSALQMGGIVSIEGIYGKLTIDGSTGDYTYTLYTPADGDKYDVVAKLGNESVKESFTVTSTDIHGATGLTQLEFTVQGSDNGVIVVPQDPNNGAGFKHIVDEDDLVTGTDTSKESVSVTESFTVTAQDGLTEILVDGLVVATWNETTDAWEYTNPATAAHGTVSVTVTGDIPSGYTVTYTYIFTTPKTHEDAKGENSFDTSFDITFKDVDTTESTAKVDVTIVDDVPVVTVTEHDLDKTDGHNITVEHSVNIGDTVDIETELFTYEVGADANADPLTFTGENGFTMTKNADGSYSVSYDGDTTDGIASQVVGTLYVDKDKGIVSFKDAHANVTGVIPPIEFTYSVTDGDKDSVGGHVSIDITGKTPTVIVTPGSENHVLQDADSEGRLADTATGTLTIGSYDEVTSITIGDQTLNLNADGSVNGSNVLDFGAYTLTFGSFTTVTGAIEYTITLNDSFVHSNVNSADISYDAAGNAHISHDIQINGADVNGLGSLQITIEDDVPTAMDTEIFLMGSDDASTSVVDNVHTGFMEDFFDRGADGVDAAGKGIGSYTVDTNVTPSINGDVYTYEFPWGVVEHTITTGAYTITAKDGIADKASFAITYTDKDGDPATAIVTIDIDNSLSVTVGDSTSTTNTIIVSEQDLPKGTLDNDGNESTQDTELTQASSITITSVDGLDVITMNVNGVDVVVAEYKDGAWSFTDSSYDAGAYGEVTITGIVDEKGNPATSNTGKITVNFEYTLTDTVHNETTTDTDGNGRIDDADAYDSFKFTVQESDGTVKDAEITVNIADDAPILSESTLVLKGDGDVAESVDLKTLVDFGADGEAAADALVLNGLSAESAYTIDGNTVLYNGEVVATYSFTGTTLTVTRNPAFDGSEVTLPELKFSYTAQDGDGDVKSGEVLVSMDFDFGSDLDPDTDPTNPANPDDPYGDGTVVGVQVEITTDENIVDDGKISQPELDIDSNTIKADVTLGADLPKGESCILTVTDGRNVQSFTVTTDADGNIISIMDSTNTSLTIKHGDTIEVSFPKQEGESSVTVSATITDSDGNSAKDVDQADIVTTFVPDTDPASNKVQSHDDAFAKNAPVEGITLGDGVSYDFTGNFLVSQEGQTNPFGYFSYDTATGKLFFTQTAPYVHPDGEGEKADSIIVKIPVADAPGNTGFIEVAVSVGDSIVTVSSDLTAATQIRENTDLSTDKVTIETDGSVTGQLHIKTSADGSTLTLGETVIPVDAQGKIVVPAGQESLDIVLAGKGTVSFKADGSYTFIPEASLSTETIVDLTFTMTDSDGDTSTTTESITVVPDSGPTGTHTVSAEVKEGGEASAAQSLDITLSNESGTIVIGQGENTVTITVAADGSKNFAEGSAHTLNGTYGMLTVTIVGNEVQYSYKSHDVALDHSVQASYTESFTVTATDNSGDVFQGSITGVVTDTESLAMADTDSVDEGTKLVAQGNILGNDIEGADGMILTGVSLALDTDDTDSIHNEGWAAASAPASAGDKVLAYFEHPSKGNITMYEDGSYVFNYKDSSLTIGESENFVFNYTAQDGDGDPTNSSLTITATGTNDTPVIDEAKSTKELTTDDTGLTASIGTLVFTSGESMEGGKITVGGQVYTVSKDAEGKFVLTGSAADSVHDYGSVTLDTLRYDSVTGEYTLTYTYDQTSPYLGHTETDNADETAFNVDSFTVQIQDGKEAVGDAATSDSITVNVHIKDDGITLDSIADGAGGYADPTATDQTITREIRMGYIDANGIFQDTGSKTLTYENTDVFTASTGAVNAHGVFVSTTQGAFEATAYDGVDNISFSIAADTRGTTNFVQIEGELVVLSKPFTDAEGNQYYLIGHISDTNNNGIDDPIFGDAPEQFLPEDLYAKVIFDPKTNTWTVEQYKEYDDALVLEFTASDGDKDSTTHNVAVYGATEGFGPVIIKANDVTVDEHGLVDDKVDSETAIGSVELKSVSGLEVVKVGDEVLATWNEATNSWDIVSGSPVNITGITGNANDGYIVKYEYTLTKPIDGDTNTKPHTAEQAAAQTEHNTSFDMSFVDKEGDMSEVTIGVTVKDDTPTVSAVVADVEVNTGEVAMQLVELDFGADAVGATITVNGIVATWNGVAWEGVGVDTSDSSTTILTFDNVKLFSTNNQDWKVEVQAPADGSLSYDVNIAVTDGDGDVKNVEYTTTWKGGAVEPLAEKSVRFAANVVDDAQDPQKLAAFEEEVLEMESAEDGDDIFWGSAEDDVLLGLGGDDTVYGGEGHDLILGGSGDDILFGDAGEDILLGGEGNDIFYTGAGDAVYGGTGHDIMVLESVMLEDVLSLDGGEGMDLLLTGVNSLETVKGLFNKEDSALSNMEVIMLGDDLEAAKEFQEELATGKDVTADKSWTEGKEHTIDGRGYVEYSKEEDGEMYTILMRTDF